MSDISDGTKYPQVGVQRSTQRPTEAAQSPDAIGHQRGRPCPYPPSSPDIRPHRRVARPTLVPVSSGVLGLLARIVLVLHTREVAGSKPAAPMLEGPARRGLPSFGPPRPRTANPLLWPKRWPKLGSWRASYCRVSRTPWCRHIGVCEGSIQAVRSLCLAGTSLHSSWRGKQGDAGSQPRRQLPGVGKTGTPANSCAEHGHH
jgi:hypothetical protein